MKILYFFLVTLFLFSVYSSKAQCPTGETNVKISIQTDNYGTETSWTLKNQAGTIIYDSCSTYTDITGGQLYIKNVCVPDGTPVIFTINDDFSDGMCCTYGNGYYKVELFGYAYASGGEFGASEATSFIVSPPPARDLTVTELNMMEYMNVGNISIAGKIKSLGGDTVTSYDINYSVNGAAPVTHSFTAQSIFPFTSVAFTHPTAYNAASSGNYNFKVWASNINGNADLNTTNDTMIYNVVVVSQVPQKYVLVEEATGAWCGYCPDGAVKLAQLLNSNPYAIGVAIHDGDAMAFADGNTVNTAYANGYPNGFVDRYVFSGTSTVGMSRALWSTKSNERMTHISPVTVDVTNTYNSSTRIVTVTVSATFYANLSEELRFNAYIVEDSLTGTGGTWNQVNYYNATAGHPMYGLGNPIIGYYHRHVLKSMLGGAFGSASSLPATIVEGTPYTKVYTYTLPTGMKEKDVKIVGLVQKYNVNSKKRAILNSRETYLDGFSSVPSLDFVQELNVYPNPAYQYTNVYFNLSKKKNVEICLYNVLGQQVYNSNLGETIPGSYVHNINISSLSKGMYQMIIKFDNNIMTKKMIIE